MKGHSSKSPDELKVSFSEVEALSVPLVCVSLQDPGCSKYFHTVMLQAVELRGGGLPHQCQRWEDFHFF